MRNTPKPSHERQADWKAKQLGKRQVSVMLTKDARDQIKRLMLAGKYRNQSEVVESALRSLEEKHREAKVETSLKTTDEVAGSW